MGTRYKNIAAPSARRRKGTQRVDFGSLLRELNDPVQRIMLRTWEVVE
jgi:hypothetical protein